MSALYTYDTFSSDVKIYSMAGVNGTVITYFGELMSNKNRPRYLAFLSSFMSLGYVLIPLLGMVVLTSSFNLSFFDGWLVYKPWRLFVFINSLIAGLGSFGMMLLPESPKFLLSMGKPRESLDIMRKIYICNTGNPKEVGNIMAMDPNYFSMIAIFRNILCIV